MDRDGRFLGLAAIALSFVVCTWIGGRTIIRLKTDDTMEVTGSARRRIHSDLVDWSATVSVTAPDARAGYQVMKAHIEKVTAFLEQHGVPRGQIVVSQVSTKPVTKPVYGKDKDKDGEPRVIDQKVVGYELHREVEVHANDCEKIAQVARDVTDLIGEGVDVSSGDPSFHYSRLGEIKIQMAAEAAKDAYVRAKAMTAANGARVGKLRASRLGVIQINAANSTETSSEGNNDTSSIDKDVITVVSSTFTLD
jgi:hypothetical protein